VCGGGGRGVSCVMLCYVSPVILVQVDYGNHEMSIELLEMRYGKLGGEPRCRDLGNFIIVVVAMNITGHLAFC